MNGGPTRVGFACAWGRDPERTWSHTPGRLREALADRARVVDVGPDVPTALRFAVRLASTRRVDGRWVSPYRWSRAWETTCERSIRHGLDEYPVDVLLQIGDFGAFDVPYFCYQDLNYDVLADLIGSTGSAGPAFPGLTPEVVTRRLGRQRRIYGAAAGLFAMSEWLAGVMTERSGVEAARVHVARPGMNVVDLTRRIGPVSGRSRLLFVGRDFERKGGEQVLAAVRTLVAAGNDVRLSIVGPDYWPAIDEPPNFVDFLGAVPLEEMRRLYDSHDLFVLPSSFEPFGISFVEALASGLPCIARNAFAMPEIVEPGRNGGLVTTDDPAELASVIEQVLAADEIFQQCWADHERVARDHSWRNVAERMLDVMEKSV